MYLISIDKKLFDSIDKEIAWHFVRDSHLNYLLLYPQHLNRILNEYLLIMNKKFKRYNDRIIQDINNVELETYSTDHLTHIENIYCMCNMLIEGDSTLVFLKFYDKLLKIVDKTLNEKYMYGKIFTNQEIELLEETIDDNVTTIDCCPQNKIIIFVPKNIFDIKKHKKKTKYSKKIKYYTEDEHIVIEFFDTKKYFMCTDLWDIKVLCEGQVFYYLEPELLTDNEMTIFFVGRKSWYCY